AIDASMHQTASLECTKRNDGYGKRHETAVRTDPFENVVPFVLTAEARSFATAARRLGVNPSSVSRAVARLEAQVGVKLLLRTSRSVSLTGEGQAFLDLCREVLEKMDQARSVLAANRGEPSGVLRMTMP